MELTYCYFHVLLVITFGLGRLSSSRLSIFTPGLTIVGFVYCEVDVTKLGLQKLLFFPEGD